MAPSYRGLVPSVLSRVTWVRIPLELPIYTHNLDNNRVAMSRIGVLNVVSTINRDKNNLMEL